MYIYRDNEGFTVRYQGESVTFTRPKTHTQALRFGLFYFGLL